jgi:hypothetical protein
VLKEQRSGGQTEASHDRLRAEFSQLQTVGQLDKHSEGARCHSDFASRRAELISIYLIKNEIIFRKFKKQYQFSGRLCFTYACFTAACFTSADNLVFFLR